MLKKNMEIIIRNQNVRIKLLRQELKVKNNMLLNLGRELENLRICKEECSLKIKEIKKLIGKQNYDSTKNVKNSIEWILKKDFSK